MANAPAQPSLDDLTRDGADKPIAQEPGEASPMTSIARMIGSLIVVLVLVVFTMVMLKRNPHVAKALLRKYAPTAPLADAAYAESPSVVSEAPQTHRPQATTAPGSFADLLSVKPFVAKPSSKPSMDAFKILGHGGLEVIGTQSLADSGTVIYLVKAGDRMMLLGASPQGGVRTLSEWDSEETRTPEEQKESFDSYLRQQGVVVEKSDAADIELSAVRARLKSATRNLSAHVEEVQAPPKKRTGGMKP
jgi:flagellar biogenesis protein FliO